MKGSIPAPAWPFIATASWCWTFATASWCWGGVASQESGQPVLPDTLFVLFSSTKAMTAACLHILWQRDQLAWDDPVARHWPGFA